MSSNTSQTSNSSRTNQDQVIYKSFCNGMKNQSREHIRLTGEIVSRLSRVEAPIEDFLQVETNIKNIGNNLNKVCAVTRQQK